MPAARPPPRAAASAEDAARSPIHRVGQARARRSSIPDFRRCDGMAGAAGWAQRNRWRRHSTPTLKVAAGGCAEFGHALADRVSGWSAQSERRSCKSIRRSSVHRSANCGPRRHAQVWLTSHSAVTRDALDQAQQSYVKLGAPVSQVDISQRSFQEPRLRRRPMIGRRRRTVSPPRRRCRHPHGRRTTPAVPWTPMPSVRSSRR